MQKAGWLYKEGDVWKTWKRRWFVLSAQLLYYYADREAQQPKGIIVLEGSEVRLSSRTERPWLFDIYREEESGEGGGKAAAAAGAGGEAEGGRRSRVYYLQADSQQERDAWMSALRNNLLYELQRTRAFIDETDAYKAKVQQLTEQLETQRAKQIAAGIGAARQREPSVSQPGAAVETAAAPVPSSSTAAAPASSSSQDADRSLYSTPYSDVFTVSSLRSRLSYLEQENARLQVENVSLKQSTLAMQGKGDEIRQGRSSGGGGGGGGEEAGGAGETREGERGSEEVEALRREISKVRMERGILKREVLRLMKVNDELVKGQEQQSSAAAAAAAQHQQGEH